MAVALVDDPDRCGASKALLHRASFLAVLDAVSRSDVLPDGRSASRMLISGNEIMHHASPRIGIAMV